MHLFDMPSALKFVTFTGLLVMLMIVAPGADALISNRATPLTLDPTNQTNAGFGETSAAGDINNDGYTDLIISAVDYSGEALGEGRAYVYMGSASGLSASPALTLDPTDQIDSNFGLNLALGDINNDGYFDALIGASDYDAEAVGEGRVYVYMGSASGLSASPALTLDPTDQAGAVFGIGTSLGDFNNDDYADAIIAAFGYSAESAGEGRAYVYMGSASGLSASPALTLDPTDQAGASFSAGGMPIADINGDGYADAIIAALGYSAESAGEGRAYVYMGSASGLSASPALTLDPTNQDYAVFGVTSLGDINGDGYADAVIRALYYSAESAGEGRAYVYMGSASGLSASPALTLDPTDQDYASFGTGGDMGDLNNDGFADVILGAPSYNAGSAGEGRAYVYLGSASGLTDTPSVTLNPAGKSNADFGFDITAADLNGDGNADAVINADTYDAEANGEGRAYVYYGSEDNLVYQDTDHDGAVDNIRWVMDENVTACPFVAGNWSVATTGTIGVTALTGLTCTGSDNILNIAVTAGAGRTGGAAAPAITYEYASGGHITLAGGNTGTFPARSAADTAAPVIVSVAPASGATSLPLNDSVTITFSEAMNGPGTGCVFSSSPDPGGFASITEASNWSDGGKTATLAHSSYRRGSSVSLAVSGCTAATGSPSALAANPAIPNPWTFTTISGIGGGGGSSYVPPAPSIMISIPVAAASYGHGSQLGLSWTAANGSFVRYKLSYSSDNGNNWTVIAPAVASTSYTWTIPDASTTQGLIKVDGLDYTGSVLASAASSAFTVIGTAPFPPPVAPPKGDEQQGTPVDSPAPKAYDAAAARENSPNVNADKSLLQYPAVAACRSGSLIRGTTFAAVYYCGADGKRYVFPTEKVYFSWYQDFSGVEIISDDALIDSPIGGNVTYRPGVRMVKIQTDPKVYAVAQGGVLRWVPDENTALSLYGANWNRLIDDLSDAFFVNYSLGAPIME